MVIRLLVLLAVLFQSYNTACSQALKQVDTLLPVKLIPSAFSPNADGVNDIFSIHRYISYPEAIDSFNCKIFDRYGELVFTTTQINFGWDGTDRRAKKLPPNFYMYIIYLRGNKRTEQTCKGSILLIR